MDEIVFRNFSIIAVSTGEPCVRPVLYEHGKRKVILGQPPG